MAADQMVERVIERAIAIQQIPSPTFAETARAALVRKYFEDEGLADVQVDGMGDVLARLPGGGDSLPLIVSAHLDTVFPAGTDLTQHRDSEHIYGPGIGDNSLGLAALFGLLWHQRETGRTLPGDIWFVANVCEEGLGDLHGMRAIVERFGDRILGYLILEGMALGQVYHRGLGVRRYRISAQTNGGHSWVDFGRPSAIHELSALVVKLTSLVLPQTPRTSLNVGIFKGGTSVNTIAAEAHLELDLRSEDSAELGTLSKQVLDMVVQANRPDAIQMSAQLIGERPAGEIPDNHWLVNKAVQALQEQGLNALFNIGSTDANLPLSRGYPAVTIGLTHGAGAHTVGEFIEIAPLAKGLDQLYRLVELAFQTN